VIIGNCLKNALNLSRASQQNTTVKKTTLTGNQLFKKGAIQSFHHNRTILVESNAYTKSDNSMLKF
jgi:hypothetical protein